MAATCRAMVLEAPGRMRLRTFELPQIGPDEALLRVELVGICGTDHGLYSGKLSAPLPLIPGHEILGRIATIGERAAERYGMREGDRVTVEGAVPCWSCTACHSGSYRFCRSMLAYGTRAPLAQPPGLWGGMAEHMYLAPGSILHKASETIPAETAIVAGLVANGVQWLNGYGALSVGDTVVIQGAGPQGLAATAVAHASGAAQIVVTGLRRDAPRLRLARELGASDVVVADEDEPVAAVRELTGDRLADVVLDATGSSQAVRASIQMVRPQGTLVLAGLTGADVETSIALDRLVWNEIRLQGVFSKDATAMAKGIGFLATTGARYPLHKIVSHVFGLEQAEDAIRAVAEDGAADGFIKAAIRPGCSDPLGDD